MASSNRGYRGPALPNKKGGGGMLSSLVGAYFGMPVGGDLMPAVDAEEEVNGRISTADPEMDDITAEREARDSVKRDGITSHPAQFSKATVSNPFMDAIFNKGAGGQQAAAINARNSGLQFQAQNAATNRAAMDKAAMVREVYGQNATDNRIGMTGDENRTTLNRGHDLKRLEKAGLSSSADPTQFDKTEAQTEQNLVEARNQATRQSWFTGAVGDNMRSELEKQGVLNAKEGTITAHPGEHVFTMGRKPGSNITGDYMWPGSDVTKETKPVMVPVGTSGRMMPSDKMQTIEHVTTRPGGYMADLEKKRDEHLKIGEGTVLRMPQSTPQSLSSGIEPDMGDSSASVPPPTEEPNTALLPTMGRNAAAGISALPKIIGGAASENPMMDWIIRNLINSKKKKLPGPIQGSMDDSYFNESPFSGY